MEDVVDLPGVAAELPEAIIDLAGAVADVTRVAVDLMLVMFCITS
jgi:hypothetical protein